MPNHNTILKNTVLRSFHVSKHPLFTSPWCIYHKDMILKYIKARRRIKLATYALNFAYQDNELKIREKMIVYHGRECYTL